MSQLSAPANSTDTLAALAGGDGLAGAINALDDKVSALTIADISELTSLTATATELNVLDGIPSTLTATELGYVDGVTSAIQTQVDTKAPTASPSFTGTVTLPTGLTGVLRGDSGVVSVDANIDVATGGTGRASHTAYAVLCGGTTTTAAQQSIASVGTSGQVLTSAGAGALPTFEDAASATSGSLILDWSNAVLPDTSFPSLGKTVGTNYAYKTLDFDTSADETAYWMAQIPSDLSSVTSATMIIYWTTTAGSSAQTVQWQVTNRTPNNDEVIDATTTPSENVNDLDDTWIANSDLHIISSALTTTNGWSPGDMVQIEITRDVSDDDLGGDAKLIMAVLEIR